LKDHGVNLLPAAASCSATFDGDGPADPDRWALVDGGRWGAAAPGKPRRRGSTPRKREALVPKACCDRTRASRGC